MISPFSAGWSELGAESIGNEVYAQIVPNDMGATESMSDWLSVPNKPAVLQSDMVQL